MSVPFSYAQAAKSRPAASSNPSTSQSPSTASPQLKGTDPPAPSESKPQWIEEAADAATVVDDGSQSSANAQASNVPESAPLESPSAPVGKMSHGSDIAAIASVAAGSVAVTSEQVDTTVSPTGPSGNDGSTGPHVNGDDENAWNVEQDETKSQAKTLKAAPPPAVNYWTHRAQTLKTKDTQPLSSSKPALSHDAAPRGAQARDAADKTSVSQSKTATKVGSSVGPQGSARPSPPRANGVSQSAPPAIKDEVSWPTPESAQDETRKRSTDRSEKPETERATSATRPHGKSEWKPVPFTPSVKFNTPLPPTSRRGGRGGSRGGRDFGGRGGAFAGPGAGSDRGAGEIDNDPSTLSRQQDAPKERRSASESQASPREAKYLAPVDQLKRPSLQEGAASVPATGRHPGHGRKPKPVLDRIALPTNGAAAESPDAKSAGDGGGLNRRRSNGPYSEHVSPGPGSASRQKPRTTPSSEKATDSALPSRTEEDPLKDPTRPEWASRSTFVPGRGGDSSRYHPSDGPPVRDRNEGRGDRGRGGRVRGGAGGGGFHHHANSPHPSNSSFQNGHTPTSPHPGSYNRFPSGSQQPGYSPAGSTVGQSSRTWRSNTRGASGQAETGARWQPGTMPTYPPGPPAAIGNYLFDPTMTPTGHIPYGIPMMPPMYEQMALVNEVAYQVNYYFSLDNLLKDTFLRKQMNGQGFVRLSLIANFKKMRSLTTDPDFIKMVCAGLEQFELQHGADGHDRIRKREGWEQWVMPVDQRDPSAQHDSVASRETSRSPGSALAETPNPFIGHRVFYPGGSDRTPHQGDAASMNFAAGHFAPSANGNPTSMPVNNRYSLPLMDSDLYRPNIAPVRPTNGSANGRNDPADAFPDEQIEKLTVVARPENTTGGKQSKHSETSRTFSNGSIDALGIEAQADEEKRSRSRLDPLGGSEAEKSSRFSSPQGVSSSNSPAREPVGLLWMKNRDSAPVSMPEGSASEPYSLLRYRAFHNRNIAIQQRRSGGPGGVPHDLQILYQFWSHFLIRNFNTTMYDEFYQSASEDQLYDLGTDGMDNLFKYYREALSSQQVIRETVAKDFVKLVEAEMCDQDSSRAGFKQLKASWRDGALNMRNRKKLSDLISSELKDKLDR